MAKKYKYNMDDQVGMAQEPMPTYGAALAEPEVEVEEDYSGIRATSASATRSSVTMPTTTPVPRA